MPDSLLSTVQQQLEKRREYDNQEIEETIEAIRSGLVDAFVVESGPGHQVHALYPFESVEELHEIVQAIRAGRVDALVVKTPSGDRVFALQGADEPYRVLIETMQEGAATLGADGTILYVNARFAEILDIALDKLVGFSLPEQLRSAHQDKLRLLINEGLRETAKGDISFRDPQGRTLHLHLALSPLPNYDQSGHNAVCVVATDVTALRQNEEALQELSARLLQAQDEERKRISRNLHDSAGQYLAAAQMRLFAVEKQITNFPQAEILKTLVADAQQAVSECSKEIRTISYLLHPPTLDLAGLKSAIEWYTDGFSERSGISVDLEISPSLDRLPQELELTIYRLVQESLTNIHRHSGSKWAGIRLIHEQDQITLEVMDRGKGMAPISTDNRQAHVGVGISGIRERVRQLDGQLTIESGPQGTTVRATFRLQQDPNSTQITSSASSVEGFRV
jgi:two-component system NarL family sensor kinase